MTEQPLPVHDDSGLAVELIDVHKHYERLANGGIPSLRNLGREGRKAEHWVINGVNISIPRGGATGIVGLNGAGKSTLLRLMCGVTAPSRGQVICHYANPCLLALGAGVPNVLTGREYATTLGILAGLDKTEVLDRMDKIKEFSGIGGAFDQPVRTYSQGMRMRVGFAAVMHCDAEFLLIDEVLAVGDKDFKAKCMVTLQRLIATTGTTVVFTSHSAAPVRKLCEQALWIEGGLIKMDGDADEVMDVYEDLDVNPDLLVNED
ncbi:MAG: ABC transporter ATP-binding protein [Acidimicrobiia bacterium]|nr:ABC transporter ATP-binding protein [Acidimicrobiia bacterium]MDH5238448.1 ABC transporter ATP-binding protein [Acidimicrobiia bacterium]